MKPKILMVTMGLNIGGAETHIVELSGELVRRGYEVIAASNGGVYVEEIEAMGIRHFNVPLHSRDIRNMYISYRRLKRIILDEKPDIVHAHARIPAFIASLVRHSAKFSFVTSAHGVYEVTGTLRFLTNWGDYSVAVSEDIKRYLIDSYGMPSGEIAVTINGIDTEKFSPDTDGSEVLAEFGLAKDGGCKRRAAAPLICHVSRLDTDSSVIAEQLVDAMRLVNAEFPTARLFVAGGGTEEARISAVAAKLNSDFGYEAIIMAGPRTDINKILAACDLFVGVSRTALEAMAMEKPVILTGNAGYMGLFEQEKTEEAKRTNFCCRESEPSQTERLAADICSCLRSLGFGKRQPGDVEPERLAEICNFERKLILKEYSVGRMTEDYERVYRLAVKPRYKVLMSGYFGFNNAGDEAILSAIYKNLSSLDENLSLSVLIAHPSEAKKHYDFRMIDRFNFFAVLRAIRSCDILISGGGSLLQDSTSTKSILYYLAIINAAKLMKKKVVLYSNGIGPVVKSRNRKLVRNAVERADLVTLRDENSVRELKDMGLERDDLHVTADPVFTYDCIGRPEAELLLQKAGIPTDKPFVGISVRNWKNTDEFASKIADICDRISLKHGRNIVFIIMQNPNDIMISERVRALMKCDAYMMSGNYSTSELMGIVGCADFVICMRLHTLIFAAHMGVPTLGIIYDPKVRYYLKMLGMPSIGEVDSLDKEYAMSRIDDVVEHHEAYSTELSERTDKLRLLAGNNERYFVEMLRRIENQS